MLKKLTIIICILSLLWSAAAAALTRDELRGIWQQIAAMRSDASPYLETADPSTFSPGALTPEAQRDALNCLNFLRSLAGLEDVSISPLYTLRAQNAALLLAANDYLDHNAPQPAGMSDELYESAHLGTSLGNIAKFNWMKPDILLDGVRYFARDDGSANLSAMGHRRWLLNPHMEKTGFGLANSESGMSYVTMYAVDMGRSGIVWDHVAWPCAQAFPVELMRSDLAWSISLNEEIYNLDASRVQVLLREENSGAQFSFDPVRGKGDGYCTLSRQPYGSGGCIIFRPEIADAGIAEYVQNQRWTVQLTGLAGTDGTAKEICYSCEMVSLYPQDVTNVELSQLEARLLPGEMLQLHADVIPAYADDTSVIWGSSDPSVAVINPQGLVSAVAPGTCTITAMSSNGRRDACELTVVDSIQ